MEILTLGTDGKEAWPFTYFVLGVTRVVTLDIFTTHLRWSFALRNSIICPIHCFFQGQFLIYPLNSFLVLRILIHELL